MERDDLDLTGEGGRITKMKREILRLMGREKIGGGKTTGRFSWYWSGRTAVLKLRGTNEGFGHILELRGRNNEPGQGTVMDCAFEWGEEHSNKRIPRTSHLLAAEMYRREGPKNPEWQRRRHEKSGEKRGGGTDIWKKDSGSSQPIRTRRDTNINQGLTLPRRPKMLRVRKYNLIGSLPPTPGRNQRWDKNTAFRRRVKVSFRVSG